MHRVFDCAPLQRVRKLVVGLLLLSLCGLVLELQQETRIDAIPVSRASLTGNVEQVSIEPDGSTTATAASSRGRRLVRRDPEAEREPLQRHVHELAHAQPIEN